MKIDNVKTAKKVGEFELRNDINPNRIKINYDKGELSLKELTEDIVPFSIEKYRKGFILT